MLLEIKDVSVNYGKLSALRDISLSVAEGGFVTLVGANGAGKSTVLRTISGLNAPIKGSIIFDGKPIHGADPATVLKAGIAHVPEGRRIFKDLTVTENLRLGAFTRNDKAEIEADLQRVFEHFPRLRERHNQLGRTMSGGEQQMLSIGRALMSRPRMLLLDEPSLGLAPVIIEGIARMLVEINTAGTAVVLVEQNADLALRLAQFGYVLENGAITLNGEASSLLDDEHIKTAYLGV